MFERRAILGTPRRLMLVAACAPLLGACGGTPTAAAPPVEPVVVPAETSLREAARSRGVDYGCAVGAVQLAADPAFARLVADECGMLVPENDLKWATLRPSPEAYDFRRADAVVAFAEAHGQRMRGHTLVWHGALPAWFAGEVTARNADAVLRGHIGTVVGRYAGRIHSWDVVNEAIDVTGGRADGLRDTPWLRLLGPDYIETAFRAAAAADPGATLVYNEYGIEYAGSDAKRRAVLQLLRRLRARGVPVHALGIQAHLRANQAVDVAGMREFLREVAALGLSVVVTELDVSDEALPSDAVVRDQAVADHYARFLDVVLAQPKTVAVMTWGLSDRYSWLHSYRPRQDGLPVRGLPLDQGFGEKAAYGAMVQSFVRAPAR